MNIFKDFNQLKVLIVGDIILDHYISGAVNRISPEAPVPVVLVQNEDFRLGGAANVALNIQALGAQAHLVSVVGDDIRGKIFVELLKEKKLAQTGIFIQKNRQTTTKTRILAKSQQLVRYDRETIAEITPETEDLLIEQIDHIIQAHKIDVVIFQDYNKGVLSPTLINRSLTLIRRHKIPTCIDPKKRNFLQFKNCTLFKPNLREINEGLSKSIHETKFTIPQLIEAAQEIHQQLDNQYTLITLGAKGLFMHAQTGEYCHIHGQERQVADVCGAGDTVISTASLALSLGLDKQVIATLANIAGGQVCEHLGVVPVNKKDLALEYDKYKN
ncbi:MAG: bifunctional ADP-heptose synthase [Saprospiraceae bacterium]|nr:bifunctional ADP-heptose synthase [Saprospiraceae bacterium]